MCFRWNFTTWKFPWVSLLPGWIAASLMVCERNLLIAPFNSAENNYLHVNLFADHIMWLYRFHDMLGVTHTRMIQQSRWTSTDQSQHARHIITCESFLFYCLVSTHTQSLICSSEFWKVPQQLNRRHVCFLPVMSARSWLEGAKVPACRHARHRCCSKSRHWSFTVAPVTQIL